MNKHDQDPSEDYGYDLAHEAMAVKDVHGGQPGHEHHGSPQAGGKLDVDEDISYDEAHEL